jgi:hypothetical protein
MASTLDINFNNTIADYMTAPSYSLYEEFYSLKNFKKTKKMDNEKQKSISEQKKTYQTKKIQKRGKRSQKIHREVK